MTILGLSILEYGVMCLLLRLSVDLLNLIRRDSNRKASRTRRLLTTICLLWECISIIWELRGPCKWESPAWSEPCSLLTFYRIQNLQVWLSHLRRRCCRVLDLDAWYCFCWVLWRHRQVVGIWQVLMFLKDFSFSEEVIIVCLRCSTSRRSRSCWEFWVFKQTWQYFNFWVRRVYWFSWWRVVLIWDWIWRSFWVWLWRQIII